MYKKKEFHFEFNLPGRFKSRARSSIGQQMRFDITHPTPRYYVLGLRSHNDTLLHPSVSSNPNVPALPCQSYSNQSWLSLNCNRLGLGCFYTFVCPEDACLFWFLFIALIYWQSRTTRDFHSSLSHCSYHSYADETQVYFSLPFL